MKTILLALLLWPSLTFAANIPVQETWPAPWSDYRQLIEENPDLAFGRAAVVELTPERWRELRRVNADVNLEIKYHNDKRGWLSETACAGYAVEKLRRLLALGWPRGALRLTRVTLKSSVSHAVLQVETPGQTYVLSNMMPFPYKWEIANHVKYWFAREGEGGLWEDLR